MSPLYTWANTLKIWEHSFEPYDDLTQWPPYLGVDYLLDPGQLKLGKGRRKKKQLKGDMDAARGYGQDKYGKGDFDRHRSTNVYSICQEPSHKASRQKKTKPNYKCIGIPSSLFGSHWV